MKHTLERLLPLLFFALLLLSCQDDANEHSHEHDDGFGITYKHFKEFKNLPGLIESAVPKNGRSRTAKGGGMYDFVIDSTSVMEANSDQGTFYTMAITRDSLRGDIFENLVIADKDTVKEAYIITYFPDKEYLDDLEYNEHAPYIGGIKLTILDYEKVVQRGGSTVEQCKYVTLSFCNYSKKNDGSVHVAGPGCTQIFWTGTTRLCETIYIPDPQPEDMYNFNLGQIGTSGGSKNPSPPKDRTDVITQPVRSKQETPHEKNCKELKKMTLNTNVNQMMNILKYRAEDSSREYGYAFADNTFPIEVPLTQGMTTQIDLVFNNNSLTYGVAHTHPNSNGTDFIPMFSISDIFALGGLERNYTPGMPKNYNKFFVTLTVKEGDEINTYAIKIEDRHLFRSWVLAYENMTKRARRNLDDKLAERQSLKNVTTSNLRLATLLNYMNEIGIKGVSIYKARLNFTSWDKVSYNSNNTSNPILFQPCN